MLSIEMMSRAIDYIEQNLDEPLEMSSIAEVAHYSPFHFQRLFQMLTNQTLGDYIRNRRMTSASIDLLVSDIKIIDLAIKYQYDSPEAFTRAFKKIFQLTPTQVRKNKIQVPHHHKLSIQVKLTAESELKFLIVNKPEFYIKGYKKTFTAKEIMKGDAYAKFWEQNENGIIKLLQENDTLNRIGAGAYRLENQDLYDAIIGVKTDEVSSDYLYVPPSKWVVFKEKGPLKETLHQLWSRIFLEWFPKTSFQHSGCTEIEVFPLGDTMSQSYEYEVWIPLRGVLHEN